MISPLKGSNKRVEVDEMPALCILVQKDSLLALIQHIMRFLRHDRYSISAQSSIKKCLEAGGSVGCRTTYRWSKNKEFMMAMVFVLSKPRIKTLELCQSTPKGFDGNHHRD